MVVFVGLTQNVADLQMSLVVVGPVLLAAVDRDTAVGALKVDVGRRGPGLGRLAGFEVHWVVWGARRLVVGMGTVGVLAHEGGSFADVGDRRLGEGVEEVVFGEDQRALDSLGVDILVGLERLLEAAARRRGEAPAGQGELWGCRALGGMIPVRQAILCKRPQRW